MTIESKNLTTSELLFYSKGEEKSDLFLEYRRRLKEIGLTEEQINLMQSSDEANIQKGSYIEEMKKGTFVECFMDEPIDLEDLTYSELVYIIEYADFGYLHKRHSASSREMNFFRKHALYMGMCLSKVELRNRMEKIGATCRQERRFVKIEKKITRKRMSCKL